jgi:MFS transporter, DHA1 family, inner membrane transport protein
MRHPLTLLFIVGNFFVATSFMAVTGLMPEIMSTLHISSSQAGLLISAFGLTAGICAPVLATMGSSIDRRKLLTVAMGCCAVANVLAALSQNYTQLMWARVLAAVTSAVFTPQAAATMSTLVPANERAPTLAKLMIGWAVGSVLGSPLNVLIGTHASWRVAFAFIGLASAIMAILVWRWVPTGVKVPTLNLRSWTKIFRSPPLLWLTSATGLTNVGGMLMFGFIAVIAKEVLHIEGNTLAALMFLSGLGSLAGNLTSVQLLKRTNAANVAYKCALSAAVVLLLWPLCADWVWLIFVLQLIYSMGVAGFPAVQQSRLVAVAPSLASATIALNSSITYLGGAIGSSLGSVAITIVGPRYMAWVAVVFTLASLACSIIGERKSRTAPEFLETQAMKAHTQTHQEREK